MRLADHQFYAPHRHGARHFFDADEARHATRALRLRRGDGLRWVDGRGGRFAGRLLDVGKAGMEAEETAAGQDNPPHDLELGVGALHDAARVEWLVEKAVELGATRVSLLQTTRVERARYRMPRLTAKALAAMKQSGRAYLPEVRELTLAAFVEQHRGGLRLLAHCYPDAPRDPALESLVGTQAGPVTWAIGPEGDFTPAEVSTLSAQGWRGVSLGEARLRTETAALAALAITALARTLGPAAAR